MNGKIIDRVMELVFVPIAIVSALFMIFAMGYSSKSHELPILYAIVIIIIIVFGCYTTHNNVNNIKID